MASINQNPALGEAASQFLADLPIEERGVNQPEIYRFIRWFGRERPFSGLTAAEIDNYAEQLSLSDIEYMKKLEMVRTFLVYGRKKGWSKTNLAIHLKTRKGKNRSHPSPKQDSRETISLTRDGYAEMEAELARLQDQRQEAIAEISRAAADKDFRENAPLEAARQRRGQLEGRIVELERTLKTAVVIEEKQKDTLKVDIGDTVVLFDPEHGKEVRYTLVSPREADPLKGKVSSASPIGHAVIGKEEGEIAEIEAPAGKLIYQIKRIER
jgi:transcription elongation factor GreA